MRNTLLPLCLLVCLTVVQAQTAAVSEAKRHIEKGNKLSDEGNFDGAKAEYEKAIALQPESYEAYYELGFLHWRHKDYEEARKRTETAIKLNPDCWLCQMNLGTIYDDSGDPQKAIAELQKAIAMAPDRGQPPFNLGVVYLRQGQDEKAVAALRRAEEIAPEYASPYFVLGNHYHRQGKLYLAFDQLFQATKLETSGERHDEAKKLIDARIVVDSHLPKDRGAAHLSYCIARAGQMTAENYRRRFPGAQTYIDDLAERVQVLDTFATIVGEVSPKKPDPEFGYLLKVRAAGYLRELVLSSVGEEFSEDRQKFEKENSGRLELFRTWAKQNGVPSVFAHPRCEYSWMGRTW